MESAAPRQFISVLENKFSQLTVSLDDASIAGTHTEQLPVYTPTATDAPVMPKASTPPEQHGRLPGPRSLAERGILRHRAGRNTKPKPKPKAVPPQNAALAVQLKRRLRSQSLREQRADGDGMEMDVDSARGGRVKRNSVRAGVLVARKSRGGADVDGDDGDVSGMDAGPSRTSATPYERNNSALVCWSRRRASSFGERPRWASLSETPPAPSSSETSEPPPPNASPRRKRSGRSASTSGLLPFLDTTDLTIRRPSLALSLMMTPLIQDVDMASPMAPTPVMRTSTESSMWAPRKLLSAPIEDTDTPVASAVEPRPDSRLPSSPPPAYDTVIRPAPTEDSDGDADDEQTPLRTAPTAPLITVRDASPIPSNGSSTSTAARALETVTEEEEEEAETAEPVSGDVDLDVNEDEDSRIESEARVVLDTDLDAMIL